MLKINIRPADPQCDFGEIAALFASQEDEPDTEAALQEEFARTRERILHAVAVNENNHLLGFYWLYFSPLESGRVFLNLVVKPEYRGQGVGRLLYQAARQALVGVEVDGAPAKKLRARVLDTCPECLAFMERRGFIVQAHSIAMSLDLAKFDDRPYEPIIQQLQEAGFRFTSMADLGNTAAAQRKLFELNDATSLDIPDQNGEHPWASFEDFQHKVCRSDWYIPAGQKVVINNTNGQWAAMSAITRFAGVDYAYNLHTGVARAYRGRKLGQAVKVTALRFARQELGVSTVRTHHNVKNAPILTIDYKFGYVLQPGIYRLEKIL